MKSTVPISVVAFLMLIGCSTTAPPATDNREAALKEIRAVEEAAIRAFGDRNAEQSSSFYAADAALMMTNMPTVKGAEVKRLLTDLMADPNFSMKFDTAKLEATKSGDLGYTRGAYTMTMTDPKTKQVLSETGKYLTVYAKQADGNWKIVDDMNNPDAPAAPLVSKQ